MMIHKLKMGCLSLAFSLTVWPRSIKTSICTYMHVYALWFIAFLRSGKDVLKLVVKLTMNGYYTYKYVLVSMPRGVAARGIR